MSKANEISQLLEATALDKAISSVSQSIDAETKARKKVLGKDWNIPLTKISTDDIKAIWPNLYQAKLDIKSKFSDMQAAHAKKVKKSLSKETPSIPKKDDRNIFQKLFASVLGFDSSGIEALSGSTFSIKSGSGQLILDAIVNLNKKEIVLNRIQTDDYFFLLQTANPLGFKVIRK